MNRSQIIVRTSLIGILANLVLVLFKVIAGLAAHSIAIVLDAVNNLSDALSSIITIIGARLASKDPDRDHPLGHGRVEYVTAAIIAVIILYAGLASLSESIKKILHPVTPRYTYVTLLIVVVAVVVKVLLGRYVKAKGEAVNSGSLIASGADALFDAVISASTLLAAIIFMLSHISLEAYLGVMISLIIVKSGYGMLLDTISDLLGRRVDASLSKAIKETINSFEEVHGAYDLLLHNYGPDNYTGSVHVEVDDTLTAEEIDALSRRIQAAVYKKNHVIITTVGIYAINTRDQDVLKMRTQIKRIVYSHEDILQMHGFHVDLNSHRGTFDIVVDFGSDDRMATYQSVCREIAEAYPDYTFYINLDSDLSD